MNSGLWHAGFRVMQYHVCFRDGTPGPSGRRSGTDVVARLSAALEVDDVVIGGGNARRLHGLPKGVRLGSNANAFAGGYRLWNERS